MAGLPVVSLCSDAVRHFGSDPSSLERIGWANKNKRAWIASSGKTVHPAGLKAVFLLAEGPEIEITPITPSEVFKGLLEHTYTRSILSSTRSASRHFSQSARLVKAIPFYYLKRPRDLGQLDSIMERLEQHLSSTDVEPG